MFNKDKKTKVCTGACGKRKRNNEDNFYLVWKKKGNGYLYTHYF